MHSSYSIGGAGLNAAPGFSYASFLLESPNSGYVSVPTKLRTANRSFAWFLQDNWKITRKLTVDYGLRWDYQTYLRERNGYMFNVSISTPNPTTGGRPGGIIFEGPGPARCTANSRTHILGRSSRGWGWRIKSTPRRCCASARESCTPRPATTRPRAAISAQPSPSTRPSSAWPRGPCAAASHIRSRSRISILGSSPCRGAIGNPIFNRPGYNVPTNANAFATQTRGTIGQTTAGFGFINPAPVAGNNTNPAAATGGTFSTPPPREGTLVARFQF